MSGTPQVPKATQDRAHELFAPPFNLKAHAAHKRLVEEGHVVSLSTVKGWAKRPRVEAPPPGPPPDPSYEPNDVIIARLLAGAETARAVAQSIGEDTTAKSKHVADLLSLRERLVPTPPDTNANPDYQQAAADVRETLHDLLDRVMAEDTK